MKPNNNILVRNLSEFDQAILEELKVLFGERTASQTVIKMLRSYQGLNNKAQLLENLCNTLQSENDELRKKIDNLRNSLKDLEI